MLIRRAQLQGDKQCWEGLSEWEGSDSRTGCVHVHDHPPVSVSLLSFLTSHMAVGSLPHCSSLDFKLSLSNILLVRFDFLSVTSSPALRTLLSKVFTSCQKGHAFGLLSARAYRSRQQGKEKDRSPNPIVR